MAQLSSYDSGNPETPETETDSTDVSKNIFNNYRLCILAFN